MSTKNFSWVQKQWTLSPWIVDHVLLHPTICKENKWNNFGYVLYSLHDYLHVLYVILGVTEGRKPLYAGVPAQKTKPKNEKMKKCIRF